MREISPKPLTDGDFSCIIHTQASIMYALNEALNPHNANYVKALFFLYSTYCEFCGASDGSRGDACYPSKKRKGCSKCYTDA